jgi:hypothetical protein
MAADNRLTAEQLAALAPGDPVTIEFARDFRRPKHVAGTVRRFVGSSCPAAVIAVCRMCTASTAVAPGSAVAATPSWWLRTPSSTRVH